MPRPKQQAHNETVLQAALEWYELQKRKIEGQISQVQMMLGMKAKPAGNRAGGSSATHRSTPGGKRTMSAAAKKRIADAQKRRWAEYRKKVSAGKEA